MLHSCLYVIFVLCWKVVKRKEYIKRVLLYSCLLVIFILCWKVIGKKGYKLWELLSFSGVHAKKRSKKAVTKFNYNLSGIWAFCKERYQGGDQNGASRSLSLVVEKTQKCSEYMKCKLFNYQILIWKCGK